MEVAGENTRRKVNDNTRASVRIIDVMVTTDRYICWDTAAQRNDGLAQKLDSALAGQSFRRNLQSDSATDKLLANVPL